MNRNAHHGGPGRAQHQHQNFPQQQTVYPFPQKSKIVGISEGFFSSGNKANEVAVRCSDNKCVVLGKDVADKCTFLNTGEESSEFPFPSYVLQCIVQWVDHYGMEGVSPIKFPKPCPYPDFTYVVMDSPFDLHFFTNVVNPKARMCYYLQLVNAAEKYNIVGLLDLLIVALGCLIRGKGTSAVLYEVLQLPDSVELEQDEIDTVHQTYPWLQDAIEPIV